MKCRAGDNLARHAALDRCGEWDVLVVSNEEDNTRAIMGEIMMAYLKFTRKIVGIIIDGPIRDIDEIEKWDFPVYCTGTTPGGQTLLRYCGIFFYLIRRAESSYCAIGSQYSQIKPCIGC